MSLNDGFLFPIDFAVIIYLQLATALYISQLVLCYGGYAELPELHL